MEGMIRPRLLASYFTIAGDVAAMAPNAISPHTLRERAEAAAEAGYVGIGLLGDDLFALLERHGAAEIRRTIAAAGLTHLEFEVLLDWFADGERRAASDTMRARFMAAVETLGAYQIKLGGDITGDVWPIERMIEGFAGVCADAAKVGAQIALEIFPASNVRDLETALAIVQGAGARNGGLLLDTWHMHRGGIPYEKVAQVPAEYIKHIELDDAAEMVVGTIMEDTLTRRRLPGEGDLDVPAFLDAIRRTGYDGLYGVEILSDEQRSRAPREAAKLSFDATMAQFERMRALA
ncbi:sugar phosphate isomerase/epimerase family protein [Sphingomonas profundi]|uniref:sugar phosphate isomerase/epimerase family protein n=1 Tax=Alterirhizorhabdus profundi TaxID=2681549 RepID=UPI0012E92FFC|nr:sugar phosphate isomerase/epimerase family protein [Sphingomonas profundi]